MNQVKVREVEESKKTDSIQFDTENQSAIQSELKEEDYLDSQNEFEHIN